MATSHEIANKQDQLEIEGSVPVLAVKDLYKSFEGHKVLNGMSLSVNRGETLAVCDWMAQDGKRWRPFLTACAFKAMTDDPEAPLPSEPKNSKAWLSLFDLTISTRLSLTGD